MRAPLCRTGEDEVFCECAAAPNRSRRALCETMTTTIRGVDGNLHKAENGTCRIRKTCVSNLLRITSALTYTIVLYDSIPSGCPKLKGPELK